MGFLGFEDMNHLLLWLFVSIISVSLYASIGELSRPQVRLITEEKVGLEPEYSDEDSLSIASQRKVVVIFVGGLTEGDFLSLIPENIHLKNVMSKDGVWGIMTASDSGLNQNELQQMFTGNDEGQGPTVLSSLDRVTVIGDPAMAQKLNIPLKRAYRFRLIDPTSNHQGFVESSRDACTVECIVDFAKRRDLWSEMNNSEVLFIFLGPNDWLNSIGGSYMKMVNMKRVLSHLDNVISTLSLYSKQLPLTYLVTSTGKKVLPFVAWGHGIRGASTEKLRLPGIIESVPTLPKKMKATIFAPLLSCLIGEPPPLNSLPQPLSEYLNEPGLCHLRAARQARNLLEVQNIGAVLRWVFSSEGIISVGDINNSIREIQTFFENGDSANGGRLAEELVKKCEITIRYFAEVRRHFLSHVIFFTIVGCILFGIVFACLEVDRDRNDYPTNRRIKWLLPSLKAICVSDVFFILLYVLCTVLTAIDGLKWEYFVYTTNLVVPWWLACRNFKILKVLLQVNHPRRRLRSGRRIVNFSFILVTCVVCVLIAFRRPAILFFVISMVVLCFLWLVTSVNLSPSMWLFSSIPLIALLSTIDGTTPNQCMYKLSGSGWVILPWLLAYIIKMKLSDCVILASSTAIIAMLLLFSSQVDMNSSLSIIAVFCNSFLLPLAGSGKLVPRLIQTFVSLGALFLILSTNGEPTFLMSFAIHLYSWMSAEILISQKCLLLEPVKPERQPIEKISSSDLRRNFFFNIYCLLASSVSGETGEFRYGSWNLSVFIPHIRCDLKLCVPVLFAAYIYYCILRQSSSQIYIALLISVIHFNCFILAAYWNVYEFKWTGNMHTVQEFEPVSAIMKLWCIVLISLWTASLLTCSPILGRFKKCRLSLQEDPERCRQD